MEKLDKEKLAWCVEHILKHKKKTGPEEECCRSAQAYYKFWKEQENLEVAKERLAARARRNRAYYQRRKQKETEEQAKERRAKIAERERANRIKRRQQEMSDEAKERHSKRLQWARSYYQKRKQQLKKLTDALSEEVSEESQDSEEGSDLSEPMSDDPICTNETIIKTEPQIRIKMELPDDITSGDNSLASSSSNFPILGTDEAPIKIKTEPSSPSELSPSPFVFVSANESSSSVAIKEESAIEIKSEHSFDGEEEAQPTAATSNSLVNEFIEQPLTKPQVMARMLALKQQLASIKKKRKQQELEITKIENQMLRERFQKTFDTNKKPSPPPPPPPKLPAKPEIPKMNIVNLKIKQRFKDILDKKRPPEEISKNENEKIRQRFQSIFDKKKLQQEIPENDNVMLRKQFQATLDSLITEQTEKLQEYEDLANLLEQYD